MHRLTLLIGFILTAVFSLALKVPFAPTVYDAWHSINTPVSVNAAIRFSDHVEMLFFGLAPIPVVKDTMLINFIYKNLIICYF